MSRHAEIAGGGIGGLTLGALLARRGWSVTVHERDDRIREVGAGLVIHNSSAVVFEELGILDRMTEGATRFRASRLGDKHGTLLMDKQLDHVSRTYNPLRSAVITAVHDAAVQAGVQVLTGSRAVAARGEGVLVLADGTERRADLVVAADGWHSAVRDSLGIGVTTRSLPTGCTRTVIPRGEFDGEDVFLELWSGHMRIGICPVSDDRTYVYFGAKEADARASAFRPVDAAYWGERFPGLPQEFVDRLDQGDAIRHAYPYVRCDQWSKGAVAVIGDALHALPPTLGQGVGLSVSNARALVEEVAHADDVPAALRAWEADSRPVTDRTQDWSMRYEKLSSRWPEDRDEARSWLLKHLPRKRLNKSLGAINDRSQKWADAAAADAARGTVTAAA
jgi:2-polyprenyl-6-methoxyphenol hydroxylase-like FAD-dependent oxidoreductase